MSIDTRKFEYRHKKERKKERRMSGLTVSVFSMKYEAKL